MLRHPRRHPAALLIGVASAALFAAGCGEESPTDSPTGNIADIPEMSIDLAAADGGTGTSDESPYFGDSYIANRLRGDLDVPLEDPLATDPRMAEMEAKHDAEVMFLRVVWGDMRRGPDGSDDEASVERTDWSGHVEVSDGILIPLMTLAFERGDYVLPPWREQSPSRQRVEFVSFTRGGKDGLLLKIVVPSPDDTTMHRMGGHGDGLTEDDLFTFSTGPLTLSFPLEAVADLDSVVMVDDRNGVSFLGFDREDLDDACLRGTLEGAWIRVENDERIGGYFRARWVGPLGHTLGHVRGRWGVLDGERVFVGKLIRRDGTYLGHLRGHWEPEPDRPGHGGFSGQWMVEGRAHGGLRGMWMLSERLDRGGFLRGVWRRFCHRDGESL